MKREYTKPQVFAESFELVEHIAGPCDPVGFANYRSAADCSYDTGDDLGVIFLEATTKRCSAYLDGLDDNPDPNPESWTGYSFVCEYGTFANNAKLFAS